MENQKNIEEVVDEAKETMEQKVEDLKAQFAKYQEEYYKLEGICDGFRVTAERLKSENDLFKQLAKRTQELLAAQDFQSLGKLYEGMTIKL